MAITNTTTQANAVTTRYTSRYQRVALARALYRQLAINVDAPQFDLENRRGMGSSYTFNFLSSLTPGTTAISESADIVPQIFRDATSTVSPTSRGEGIKWSELIDLQAYTDFVAARAEILAENAEETIDNLAKAAALQGSAVIRGAARSSLDAGTAGHLLTSSPFWSAASLVEEMRMPALSNVDGQQRRMAICHTDVLYDMINSNNVLSVALYQDKEILFNGEIGSFAGFKIVASPWAKVFYGAGAANGSSASTTLNDASALALDKTMVVSSATNINVGRTLAVGTIETGDTHYDTNESVRYVSGTTTVTFVGKGSNGGFRFDHANGDAVNNSDNVYPVAYGSPQSLVHVYAREVGPMGMLVGPKPDGMADQWQTLSWKYYGNFGRVAENRILRGEYASSLQA